MNKILIIEDDYGDYLDIINSLGTKNYSFIPEFINEENNSFKYMWEAIDKGILEDFVGEKIKKHSKELKAIICDYQISLLCNPYNGIQMIKFLRKTSEMRNLCEKTPIIFNSSTSNKKLLMKH